MHTTTKTTSAALARQGSGQRGRRRAERDGPEEDSPGVATSPIASSAAAMIHSAQPGIDRLRAPQASPGRPPLVRDVA